MRRLLICGSLLFLSFFLSFVVWFQSGLTLAQPLAAVLPGHRGPHIFWPAVTSLLFIIAFVTGAVIEGAKLPPALGLAFMASTLAAAGLPGYDIRQGWRLITKLVSTVDVLCLFTLIGMGAASRATVDWFLLGDYPALAYLLMFWFLFAAIWKIVRATRLHLILAESGMTGIPGLNLGMQHMYDQPYKPAPGWSMASWQFNRMENAVDRRISGMDRMSWADKLRAGLPLNWGVWIGILMVAIVVLIPRLMTGVRPNRSSPEGMPYVLGTMQAAMMMLMMNAQVWVSRRGSIAADFLRPVSREKFWSALRMAIFHDLKPGILFGLAGVLLASYFANKGAISPLSILNTIVRGIGCYAFLHAWVVKLVISKRLAWDVTLAVVTSAVIVGMSIGSVILTFGERATPLIAILLSLGVLVSGGLMQRDLARQLPDWELG